jgi:aminopeptidase N
VQTHFDAVSGIYTLSLSQSCPPTPGQPDKQPFVIPVALGLIDAEGRELTSGMHVLTQASETLTFPGYTSEPVPSVLRGFSAPVVLEYDYSDQQLLALLAHDTDPFNRWEAAQRLATGRALTFIRGNMPVQLDAPFIDAMRSVLRHPDAGRRLQGTGADAAGRDLHRANSWTWSTRSASTRCARRCASSWRRRCSPTGNGPRGAPGQRRLHARPGVQRPPRAGRLALTHLCLAARASGDTVWPGKAYQRFKDASNMTDRFNALAALVVSGTRWRRRRCSASTPCSRTRRWCWTSGSRCRPARRTAAATSCRSSSS